MEWSELEVLLVVPDVREERLLHLGHEETVLARATVTGMGNQDGYIGNVCMDIEVA